MLHNIFLILEISVQKVSCIDFYKKQIDYYNKRAHDILTKEIPLMLPYFQIIEKKGEA